MSIMKLDTIDAESFSYASFTSEGSHEPFSHQLPFKELLLIGLDEGNVNVNPAYFILSSGEIQNVVDNSAFSITSYCDTPIIKSINDTCVTELRPLGNPTYGCEAENFHEIDIFDKVNPEIINGEQHSEQIKNSGVYDVSFRNDEEANTGNKVSNFDNQILKRNSLLPSKMSRMSSKRKITCDKCKLEFKSASKYYTHRNLHMQKGGRLKWYCAQCGKEFDKKDELKNHELNDHGEIRMYPCPYCVHSFLTLILLEYHIDNIHHGKKRFKCRLCYRSFFKIYDLKMHLNVHLDIKNYICDLCGKQFSHSSNLVRHTRTHTKVKPFTCDICSRRFSQIPSLHAHKISHTKGGTCSCCRAKFYSIGGLRNHMKKIHKKVISNEELHHIFFKTSLNKNTRLYHCEICSKQFRFKKELKNHEKKFHSLKSIPCKGCFTIFPLIRDFKSHACLDIQPVVGIENYKCSMCQAHYSSFEESVEHTCLSNTAKESNILSFKLKDGNGTIIKEEFPNDTVVMHISSSEEDHLSPLIQSKLNIIKKDCENSDQRKINLPDINEIDEFHISTYLGCSSIDETKINAKIDSLENKHCLDFNVCQPKKIINEKNINLFKCTHCHKSFSKSWNWKQHIATHDPSLRRYTCNKCGKTFSYRSTYTNHFNTSCKMQSLKIIFSCSQCLKTYKTKNSLNQHVKRFHEKQCNYYCGICSKGFFNKTEHSYHMRIHNNECPYICATCGKKFSHISHLHRHEKMHLEEKPHKCPHCPKEFIQPVTLRAHLKKHEEVKSNLTRVKDSIEPITQITNDVMNDVTTDSEKYFTVINLNLVPILSTQFMHEPVQLKMQDMTEYDIDIDELNSI